MDDLQRGRAIIEHHRNLFDTKSCPTGSAMHLGLQLGAGWMQVIERMCERLVPLAPGTGLQITSVKSKMGTLRVSYRGGSDATRVVIEAARIGAAAHCEGCGGPGTLREVGGWWMVRCGECAGRAALAI